MNAKDIETLPVPPGRATVFFNTVCKWIGENTELVAAAALLAAAAVDILVVVCGCFFETKKGKKSKKDD